GKMDKCKDLSEFDEGPNCDGEHMAPGCTMGRRRAGGGSVMLWAMFCWETLGPAIHVDITLTCTTYLNNAADHVHPFMETEERRGEERRGLKLMKKREE
ncbi:hypothetical protein QTP86_027960, partial [Hemibagrus guttatus]